MRYPIYYIKIEHKTYISKNRFVPLLCSHPSLTITTLVMLVDRVEDPGFPEEESLRFSKFSSLAPAHEALVIY